MFWEFVGKIVVIVCVIDWLVLLIFARKGMLQSVFETVFELPSRVNPYQNHDFDYDSDSTWAWIVIPVAIQAIVLFFAIFFASLIGTLVSIIFFLAAAAVTFLIYKESLHKDNLKFESDEEENDVIGEVDETKRSSDLDAVVKYVDYYFVFNIIYFAVLAYIL